MKHEALRIDEAFRYSMKQEGSVRKHLHACMKGTHVATASSRLFSARAHAACQAALSEAALSGPSTNEAST